MRGLDGSGLREALFRPKMFFLPFFILLTRSVPPLQEARCRPGISYPSDITVLIKYLEMKRTSGAFILLTGPVSQDRRDPSERRKLPAGIMAFGNYDNVTFLTFRIFDRGLEIAFPYHRIQDQ